MDGRTVIDLRSIVPTPAQQAAPACRQAGAGSGRQGLRTRFTQPGCFRNTNVNKVGWHVLAGMVACAVLSGSLWARSPQQGWDNRLQDARRYVEESKRYIHHSKLKRGMTGYGLTVLSGTEIVRFDAEVVSVMRRWGPHQDTVLVRLSGQGLEKTGIIKGMSGSPVYVRDPADEQDKLIGAVAYGWQGQKGALCGVQPITQMLAITGIVKRPDWPKSQPGTAAGGALPEYLSTVLAAEKADFSRFAWPASLSRRTEAQVNASATNSTILESPRMRPIGTALMISGVDQRVIADAMKYFSPAGITAVQAGGVTSAQGAAEGTIPLAPGSGIAIALVTGDADFTAIGTVTDVIGKYVLGLGHAAFGEGDVSLPMGPAYVHAVVPGVMMSFKLGSAMEMTGALTRDEKVGVAGQIGPTPSMIPMTVHVRWKGDGLTQVYHYNICRHRWLMPILTNILLTSAVEGWRDIPDIHTLRHRVEIDFGDLGIYRAENVASDDLAWAAASDMLRPMTAMLHNPFGAPPAVERIDVSIEVEATDLSAEILDIELDERIYKPGQTITGRVVVRPFRTDRMSIPLKFDLPHDIPDGKYQLTACGAVGALGQLKKEMPHLFSPRTVKQLFAAIQRVVQPRADRLYLRLPIRGENLSVRQRELPNLPASKAGIIAEADLLDTTHFTRAVVRTISSEYVLTGSVQAAFSVQKKAGQTILHKQGIPEKE